MVQSHYNRICCRMTLHGHDLSYWITKTTAFSRKAAFVVLPHDTPTCLVQSFGEALIVHRFPSFFSWVFLVLVAAVLDHNWAMSASSSSYSVGVILHWLVHPHMFPSFSTWLCSPRDWFLWTATPRVPCPFAADWVSLVMGTLREAEKQGSEFEAFITRTWSSCFCFVLLWLSHSFYWAFLLQL